MGQKLALPLSQESQENLVLPTVATVADSRKNRSKREESQSGVSVG